MRLTPSQQEALNIDKHICVTAGAGSGKTTVLVERYLKILREGNVTPREIVAITFTEKAAAEMKDRIIKELPAQYGDQDSEQSNSIQRFRDEMNSAHISTIHSFCSSILREFPFQAGVPANFSIVQGIEQKLLLQKTLKKTLKDIATNPDDLHRAELTHLLQRYGGQQKLVDFLSDLIDKRDILEHLMREIYDDQNAAEIRADWRQSERIELIATIDRLMSQIDITEFIPYLNAVLEKAEGNKAQEVKILTQQLEAHHAQNPEAPEVLNLLRQIAKIIVTTKNEIRMSGFLPKRIDRTGIATEISSLVSTAIKIKNIPTVDEEKSDNKKDDVETDNDDKTDVLEIDENFLISTTRDLLTLYIRTSNDYEKDKLSQSTLDQNDLQMKTRDLLRNDEETRQKLIKRYKYYMIDEYQDTNELQHELVMLLTNEFEGTNIFIVGDPKQSIYGFRGADVRVFEQTKQQIIAKGGLDISLSENFRTLRDPIGFTNYFFDHLMSNGSENKFEVPYEVLTEARQSDTDGNVNIILGKKDDQTANEYALIAQHIKNMKANSIAVNGHGANGSESPHPIAYGDIAILIRYRTHLPDIEHALLEAGIPYLTTKGVGFYQRQEIYDIWNYLNFLNEPVKNEASLAAVLRGPAFGISDAELYEISLQEGANFWDKAQNYQAQSDNNFKRAITILKQHRQFVHRMSVNQLICMIVNETGMIGTLKTGIYGQQRWANYQKLLELARNFDGDENIRILSDFIEFMDTLIKEEPREGEAIIEESRGAVQIMTIHAAKGKEFPIVILPCLDRKGRPDTEPFIDETLGIGFCPLKPDEGYRKTEPKIVNFMKNRANAKQTAEKKRLFYVGATRAEDHLILSGTLSDNGKADQILEWLHAHLNISQENDSLSIDVEQNVFADGSTNRQRFQLQIPIARALADLTSAGEISDEITPIEFPEHPLPPLEPTEISASFSVAELANYARCPLRYQLENVLRIPTNEQRESNSDDIDMNTAARYILARIRPSDLENLDVLIDRALENYPEATTESKATLRTYVSNFINSELGETARVASETRVNQQIHADINGHIIDGRLDRIFKDETGNWQIINYETDKLQNLDTYRPEMELYSLLAHRRYPNQSTVTINLFFTEENRCEQIHFDMTQLQDVQEQWQKRISALQRGVYEKNLGHCCSCPYADPDGACIITEP